MAMGTYTVRMNSGDNYYWTGDPVSDPPVGWDLVNGFLTMDDGSLLCVSQVQQMTLNPPE